MLLYYFNGLEFVQQPDVGGPRDLSKRIFASVSSNEIRLFQGEPSKEVPGKILFSIGYHNLLGKPIFKNAKLPKVFNGKYDITHLSHNRYDGSYLKIKYF